MTCQPACRTQSFRPLTLQTSLSLVIALLTRRANSHPELDLREVADLVFLALEQFEQGGNRLAVDLRLPRERTAFGSDPVNPAVHVIAVRVTKMALQMADEGVMPVDHVQRAIGSDARVDRAE